MSENVPGHFADVLLVEDNPADAQLTRIALRRGKIAVNLHHVEDGDEALKFLRRQGPYARAPIPDLVLLDLNLPKRDGREVLSEMRADPDLEHIPVVVLTTSSAEEDVLSSYKLKANCFITKPVDVAAFQKIVRSLDDFWFAVVTLPPKIPPGGGT